MPDQTQRFLFDDSDVRGEIATLEESYQHVLAKHTYPEPVAQLLGELLAAAALLVGTLKFDGLLILQARSSGAVPLLMVECSSAREVRGIARYHAEQIQPDATLTELMPEGMLAITIDPANGQRYQGIVDLEGHARRMPDQLLRGLGTVADALLAQCRQPPRLRPAAATAAGRPTRDPEERDASWEHLRTLADTLTAEELLGLDSETLLHRLYHQEQLRLFDALPIRFRCSCSRERSARALVSLGEEDALQLVAEQGGSVSIDCQFCNEKYTYDAADVAQLFAGGGSDAPSDTRH